MCEPTLILGLMMAASAYQQSKAAKGAADYQARVAERNSELSEIQAQDAIERGNKDSHNVRRAGQQRISSQRAAYAAAGLDLTGGSAESMLDDTAFFNEMDQNTVRENAAREAWGYRVQGAGAQGTADMFRARAEAENPLFAAGTAAAGSYYGSGGQFGLKKQSALGSGRTVADKWYSGTPSSAGYA